MSSTGTEIASLWTVRPVEPIIFVSGCFDVLHLGHVELLRFASKFGKVIVGINDDATISMLKGSSRPINVVEDRRRFLVALKWVSRVIVFYEQDPCEAIKFLKPDLIVKGSDWHGKDYPEMNLGVPIAYFPRTSHSTTDILERGR